jgi:diguanylate cyclase (GGDEF) domain
MDDGNYIGTLKNNSQNSDDEMMDTLSHIAIAIGTVYYAIYRVDLKAHTFTCFRERYPGLMTQNDIHGSYEEIWDQFIKKCVEAEDREKLYEFSDITALPKKLKDSDTLITVYRRINYGWTRGQFFVTARDADGFPTGLIFLVSDINSEVEDKEKQKKAEYAAIHDPLTGVYNRNGFKAYTDREALKKGCVGFALLDIDSFKSYNDIYGHSEGDEILKKTANALFRNFSGHPVFRFGGDEFGILLSNCTPPTLIRSAKNCLRR